MIVLIPYINLLNLSWIIKCLFLRHMEPLKYKLSYPGKATTTKHRFPKRTLPMTALVGRLSLSVGWKNGHER